VNPGAGSSANDSSFCQGEAKLLPVIELRHLHIGVANFSDGMGVASCAGKEPVILGEEKSLGRMAAQGNARIKHLNNVNIRDQGL